MKKIKKLVVCSTAALVFLFCAAINVYALWSGQVTVQPPGWGGSVISWVGVTKTSNSSNFTVYGIKESNSLDPYAQLVNSNGVAKSGWCPIRQGSSTTVTDNAGIPNYIYYTRAKTNNLEPNSNVLSYQFNPY